MPKTQKTKIISIIAVILLVLSGAYLFSLNKVREESLLLVATQDQAGKPEGVEQSAKEEIAEATQNSLATLEISGVQHQDEIKKSTSVYDFMDKLRSEGKINFKDKTYLGMGKFIEEINGIRGDGTKYWIYYVNGKKAHIGVSNYKINPSDVVSWRYEKETY